MIDVTKGKIDKKNLGNNSYLASFELFLMLCQQIWTAVKNEDIRYGVGRANFLPGKPHLRRTKAGRNHL